MFKGLKGNKRTVSQAISAFTTEFEAIKADQEKIAQVAKEKREAIMAKAFEEAATQSNIESDASLEADRAEGAINKFKDFFGV